MDSLKITKRNVTIFTVFVLIYGWVGVFIDKITDQTHYENIGTLSNNGTLIGVGIFLASPLILVFILRTFCGDGWKDAGYKPNFRKNRKWYLFSYLIYPTVTVFMLILGYLTKTMVFNPISISVYLTMLIGQLFIQIIKNFFEESVWRGYLTSKLMKFSWSDWKLYVVSALICNFWHLPYYLVFLSKEEIEATIPVGRLCFVIVATICILCWNVMYVEIYRAANSIWPLVIMHAIKDAVINPLLLFNIIYVIPKWAFIFSLSVGIIPTVIYLCIGLYLRGVRMKKES